MKRKGEAPQQQKKTLAQDSVERLVVDQERFQRKDSVQRLNHSNLTQSKVPQKGSECCGVISLIRQ